MSQDPRKRAILAGFALGIACSLMAGAVLLATGIVLTLEHFSVIGSDVRGIVRPLIGVALVTILISIACSGAAKLGALSVTPEHRTRRRYVASAFQLCAAVGCLVWIVAGLAG